MIDWGKVVTVEDKAVTALADLKYKVAMTRYNHEVSGITVAGMAVDTGRDSQGLIAGACLAAIIDPDYVVNWKTSSGEFLPLTAQQIIGVATAVRAHVQACVNREHELVTMIDNNTFLESMLEQGWPE
ncbi:hypothetical protein D3C71_1400000 [compost metagenome]